MLRGKVWVSTSLTRNYSQASRCRDEQENGIRKPEKRSLNVSARQGMARSQSLELEYEDQEMGIGVKVPQRSSCFRMG